MSFVSEVKRRKVFQVAAVYLVVAWLIMQVVDVVSGPLLLPDLFARIVILVLAIGFPITVLVSWAFNLTPEGVVKDRGAVQSGGRRIEYVLIGLLVVAMGWVIYRVEINPSGAVAAGDSDVLTNSVAVLPFENLSPDPDDAYFSAGIHEQIINELVKISDLRVIARTSVMQYAGAARPMSEIADELRVEMLMEGSVRYAGDQVRVTAQLIDGETGIHIWTEDYDGDLADIFGIQSAIAERIAMELEVELSPEEQQRIERVLTSSPEAHLLFLQAMELRDDPSSHDDLQRYLDDAIELDPSFARAHALKANEYFWATRRAQLPDDEGRTELEYLAWEHVGRALSLDSEENLAYVAMANLGRFNWRAAEAEGAFEQALRLAPNDPLSLNNFAHFLSFLGEYERAFELAERAIELSPADNALMYVSLRSGDFERAYTAVNDRLRVGNDDFNWIVLAIVEFHRGNEAEALASLQRVEDLLMSARDRASVAQVYGLLGRPEDALRQLGAIERIAETLHIRAIDWVRAYLGAGEYEQALSWLRRIDEDRNPEDAIDTFQLAINGKHDPALERPEFLEIRNSLALRQ